MAWAAAGRALRPVAEAEARERAFIRTASHDLVTPLMAVTANCDVLEAEASDQAGLASWVANTRAAADKIATLLRHTRKYRTRKVRHAGFVVSTYRKDGIAVENCIDVLRKKDSFRLVIHFIRPN